METTQISNAVAQALDGICVNYPAWNEAMDEIARVHRSAKVQREPQSMLITGHPGAGKTTLLRTYKNAHVDVDDVGDKTVVGILSINVPAKPTEKNLSQALLDALGDPFAPQKTTGTAKTQRVVHLIRECGVGMIMLDEFQHVLNLPHDAREAMDWIKTLMNEARVPLVAAGLPCCEDLIDQHPQMKKRLSCRFSLDPFDVNTSEGRSTFATVLTQLGQALPCAAPDLRADSLLIRQHYAACGLFGYVTKLWIRAKDIALERRAALLTMAEWKEAFRREFWRKVPEQLNPFSNSFVFRPLTRKGEPFYGICGEHREKKQAE